MMRIKIHRLVEQFAVYPVLNVPYYPLAHGAHKICLHEHEQALKRKYHHNSLTFRQLYATTENFVLPLSHDEVVRGKGSLLGKMPGDEWQKFANLRLLLGYMWAQNGKKLLFMGSEFGQGKEWNHDESLEWHLTQYARHQGIQTWIKDLNALLCSEPALYQKDFDPDGFQWVECNDYSLSVISFLRKGQHPEDTILVLANFTPQSHERYSVGVPCGGYWRECLNSDSEAYGGSDWGNRGGVQAIASSHENFPYTLILAVPPLSISFFKDS